MALQSKNFLWDRVGKSILHAVERKMECQHIYVARLLSFQVRHANDFRTSICKWTIEVSVGTQIVGIVPFEIASGNASTPDVPPSPQQIQHIAECLVPQMLLNQEKWAVPDVK